MSREQWRRLDHYRRTEAGPFENTLLDEYVSSEIDRSEFLRRATVFGLSASAIGAAATAVGAPAVAVAKTGVAKAGGRIRVGIIPAPVGAIDPHSIDNIGGGTSAGITGEFLTRAQGALGLVPELALSWKPNADGTVWTFKLRPNVRFQSGQTFGADDVVTTFNRLVDPNSGSQALSTFAGVLSPGGITKVDDLTVAFKMDAPNAGFPYLVSDSSGQPIILPRDYVLGTFTSKPQTTGGFQITNYQPGVSISYDRYPGWWGGTTPLDGIDATYYNNDAAVVAALLGGQIDIIGEISVTSARGLLANPNVKIYKSPGGTHRQICIRCDMNNPLKDYRVRQAVALTLDRPAIIKSLWAGLADIGNDHPFAPVYPTYNKKIPQRKKDLRKAKQLMAAAGREKGFPITLTTETVGEVPQLAQIIQQSVRPLNIKMKLNIMSVQAYFAGEQKGPPKGWGNTPWLNTPINITDWSHRAVPNVFLSGAYKTKAVWNASHYSNKKYDSLLASFFAAIALKDQKKYADQLATILLHDTPTIIPFFQNHLQASSSKVKGFEPSTAGQVYLSKTSLA